MADKVHLHRDYHTSECGKDASHIPMTYDEAAATCAACAKGKVKRLEAEARAEAEALAEVEAEQERQRKEDEDRAKAMEEHMLNRLAARVAEEMHRKRYDDSRPVQLRQP